MRYALYHLVATQTNKGVSCEVLEAQDACHACDLQARTPCTYMRRETGYERQQQLNNSQQGSTILDADHLYCFCDDIGVQWCGLLCLWRTLFMKLLVPLLTRTHMCVPSL